MEKHTIKLKAHIQTKGTPWTSGSVMPDMETLITYTNLYGEVELREVCMTKAYNVEPFDLDILELLTPNCIERLRAQIVISLLPKEEVKLSTYQCIKGKAIKIFNKVLHQNN